MTAPRYPVIDMGVVWRLMARARSGHPGYVRAINENVFDAQRCAAAGDHDAMRRWGARAVRHSLLLDRGHHDPTAAEWEWAGRDAGQLMGTPPEAPLEFRRHGNDAPDRFSDDDRAYMVEHATQLAAAAVDASFAVGSFAPESPGSDLVVATVLAALGLEESQLRPAEADWVWSDLLDAYWSAFVDVIDRPGPLPTT